MQKGCELKSDTVVFDITALGLSGMEAARRILAVPHADVLFLTVHDSEQRVQQALNGRSPASTC
jgi:DNA-binding NarL/FixJ family response regulator